MEWAFCSAIGAVKGSPAEPLFEYYDQAPPFFKSLSGHTLPWLTYRANINVSIDFKTLRFWEDGIDSQFDAYYFG